jgi:hypothetical protein
LALGAGLKQRGVTAEELRCTSRISLSGRRLLLQRNLTLTSGRAGGQNACQHCRSSK